MNAALAFVLGQIANGKIDQATGTQLVKLLRSQEPEHVQEPQQQAEQEDIAIIGMAVRLPLADHYEQFWRLLASGASCIREVPERRKALADRLTSGSMRYAQAGYLSEIDDFDYSFFRMSPAEANVTDPCQRIFLQTAWAALEDAGYGGRALSGTKTGVFIGYNAWPTYGMMVSRLHPEQMAVALPGNIAAMIGSRLNHLLDLQGPSLTIDTTCSSSLVAVHTACSKLQQGDCDYALAGGIKLNIIPVDKDFKMGIETAGDQTRTFDDAADGTLWGEGSAAVLLKPLRTALRDRDHVHAVIKGGAMNHDGTSIGLTAPNANAQQRLLEEAWRQAGVHPETITYIEAHGTGTRLGDPIELDGITRAFRTHTSRSQFCAISSLKSNIGHLDGASGIASLVKAVMCLVNRKLPPTLGFARPNRDIRFEDSPVYVNDRLRDWRPDGGPLRCGVSSFGFSGTNCHLVLEQAPSQPITEARHSEHPELLTLSAKEPGALRDYVRAARAWMAAHPDALHSDLCYAANTGRDAYRYRAAFVASTREEMVQQMGSYLAAEGHNRSVHAGERVDAATMRTMIEEWRQTNAASTLLLQRIADGFTAGADIPWSQFYADEKRHRVPFPTYPFRAYKCWMEVPADVGYRGEQVVDAAEKREERTKDELEQIIAAIWQEVLGLKTVAATDDFFAMGGHSILAIQVEAKMEEAGLQVKATDLERYPTLVSFTEYALSRGQAHIQA